MMYRALYRAWRPQTFSDIVGQQHVTRTLKNALKHERFSHAYLFSGPRGTGKTSAAKVMAKAVNCEQGPAPEPCNTCTACERIAAGSLLDVVEIDAASNRGVEEIRDLRDKVKYAPSEVRMKVYIIDEVHMLTTEAFNALLKTLEEPPQHVMFILATTEPHKLPLTIISRCQRFDFRRVSTEDIVARLAHICEREKIRVDDTALSLIAQASEGGLRDALSLLDQAYAFGEDHITEADIRAIIGTVTDSSFREVFTCVAKRDPVHALDTVSELMREGVDPEKFTEDLLHYLRDMLLVKTAPQLTETKQRLLVQKSLGEVSEWFTEDHIFTMMDETNRILGRMKGTTKPRILLEMLLVKLTHEETMHEQTGNHHEWHALQERVKRLEQHVQKWSAAAGDPSHEKRVERTGPKASSRPKRKRSTVTAANLQQVQEIRNDRDDEILSRLKEKWPQILAMVKDKKITVHAWLIDGEPVAANERHILLAFKNQIHRETTEKPDHKQLIEDVIGQVVGHRLSLLTCMQNEWQRLEVESAEDEQSATGEDRTDDHVQKALEWFGEDLVEIKD